MFPALMAKIMERQHDRRKLYMNAAASRITTSLFPDRIQEVLMQRMSDGARPHVQTSAEVRKFVLVAKK